MIRMFRACLALSCLVALGGHAVVSAAEPIDIGNRREPFVDRDLIDAMTGVAHEVQQPAPREVVLTTDAPWEGNTSAYYTIFQDGDLYRMYYRGSHFDEATRKGTHPEVTCYAESRDGIHWTKPNLGLYEFNGSRENNIVWNGIGTHCFTPFKDANPAVPPEARYKAVSRGRPQAKEGLYIFQSPDGLHWTLMQDEPVITEGAFDSQNLAFWDVFTRQYRCYHRDFRKVRDIKTQTSDDFVNWTAPEFLTYPDRPLEHLYTNAILNDPRAPHILIGFPTRYLPNEGERVEPTFMSSRDGKTFHRWLEPVIPESAPLERKGNRSNYMTWGVLSLPDAPNEYSVYATEAYYTGPDSRVRRFTYRVDGFVALKAGSEPGEVATKPLRFSGKRLLLNYATGKSGSLQVELQDADGQPIPGFALSDGPTLAGDEIDGEVRWTGDRTLESLAGTTIRIRFVLTNGSLYSLKFD